LAAIARHAAEPNRASVTATRRRCWLNAGLIVFLLAVLAASTQAAEPARRIVSLAPSVTELAFDAGAGDRLVGVVEYSDFPAQAKKIMRVGDAFQVDFEKILALRPDLILTWEPGTPAATVERLRAFGLNVVAIHTAHLADIARAVRRIGELADTRSMAEEQARRFEEATATLQHTYSQREPVSMLLEIQHQPLYTISGEQIMSEIITGCGGRNIFADLRQLTPTVSIEAVIAANPQAIITLDEEARNPIGNWSQWSSVTAVKDDNVFKLEANLLSRSTLRTAQGMKMLCESLETARQRLDAAIR
jgi:iron complex transport system substrate-binding protein